jgi:hypothetical protein
MSANLALLGEDQGEKYVNIPISIYSGVRFVDGIFTFGAGFRLSK